VLDTLTGVRSTAEACREYRVSSQVLGRWRAQFLEGAAGIFERGSGHNEAERRIAELERTVGRLTLELEVAKKPPAS
jgi:transposase